ncbi:MAG: hypothetical protein U1F52_03580 [Burkholderiales bacterium]
MTSKQPLTPLVESYRFWDIVTLWGRERLEHEEIVARGLARGFVVDGLRIQSVDPRWTPGADPTVEFKGYPHVGYRAGPALPMCIVRVEALQHLLAIVQRAETPAREKLMEEFVTREDFRQWLLALGLRPPAFWFGAA